MESIGRLGALAHDFNNILTGIIVYLDLLLGGRKRRGFAGDSTGNS
jgi:hypothetical protein